MDPPDGIYAIVQQKPQSPPMYVSLWQNGYLFSAYFADNETAWHAGAKAIRRCLECPHAMGRIPEPPPPEGLLFKDL